MSLSDRNSVTISGILGRGIFYKPGKILRFTLAGTTRNPITGKDLVYYQDIIVPGSRADAVHTQLREGQSYLVQGRLTTSKKPVKQEEGRPERTETKYQVLAFSVTPIYRKAEGQPDRGGFSRLEDAMNWVVVMGNLARDARSISSPHGNSCRAVLAVTDDNGKQTADTTNFLPLKAEGDEMSEALGGGEKGHRLVVMGPLFTERYPVGEGEESREVKQSTILVASLEYIGVLDGTTPIVATEDMCSH